MKRSDIIKIIEAADADHERPDAGPFADRIWDALTAYFEAAGWQLVPVEPTDDMIDNAYRADPLRPLPIPGNTNNRLRRLEYAAMLAAAPKPWG